MELAEAAEVMAGVGQRKSQNVGGLRGSFIFLFLWKLPNVRLFFGGLDRAARSGFKGLRRAPGVEGVLVGLKSLGT